MDYVNVISPVSAAEIEAAAGRIAPHVCRTPIVTMVPTGIGLKAESLQPIGAFKLRGAFNFIMCLDEEAKRRGIVTHSSGNHAQAVAYAAHRLGISATIVMPEDAPAVKRAGTDCWGPKIVVWGTTSAQRQAKAEEIARDEGLTMVPPFDAREVVAGAATITLEILQDRPDVRTIVVCGSGGGQLGGAAAAVRAFAPQVEVVGVETAAAGHISKSVAAGANTPVPDELAVRSIADGLRVGRLGDVNWANIGPVVRRVMSVSEGEIVEAMVRIASEARLIAEPSGATSLAGALKLDSDPATTVAIVSGGNVDLPLYARLVTEGL